MTNVTMRAAGELLAMLASSPQRRANAVLDVAKLMRGRAEKATPGTWGVVDGTEVCAGIIRSRDGYIVSGEIGLVLPEDDREVPAELDAVHIASMANPAVAIHLADWLEDCAARYLRGQVIAVSSAAAAVAGAYLAVDVEES